MQWSHPLVKKSLGCRSLPHFTHQVYQWPPFMRTKLGEGRGSVRCFSLNIPLGEKHGSLLLAHGDVRVKEWTFLPDAVHTNPQPQTGLETGCTWRWSSLSELPLVPPPPLTPATVLCEKTLHHMKMLSPEPPEFKLFYCDLQQYIFITTQYTHMNTCKHRLIPEKSYIKKSKPIFIIWDSLWNFLTFFFYKNARHIYSLKWFHSPLRGWARLMNPVINIQLPSYIGSAGKILSLLC